MKRPPDIEIHISNDAPARHVADVAKMGFTRVLGEDQVAHAAIAQDLRFVLARFWTSDRLQDWHNIKPFAPSENLVSVNMADEPIYWDHDDPHRFNLPVRKPSHYQQLREQIKQEFDVPLSLSFFGPDEGKWASSEREDYFFQYWPTIDHLRMNIFPAYKNRPLGVIFTWVDKLTTEMRQRPDPKPLTVTLQTWTEPDHPRHPTVPELRVMAFAVLLGGAQAVSFYQYDPQVWKLLPDNFLGGFSELIEELRITADKLVGATTQVVSMSQGVYEVHITRPSHRSKVLVNTTDRFAHSLNPYEVRWID